MERILPNTIVVKDFSFGENVVHKLITNILCHPFNYACFLMRIGHEPLPPYPTRSILGLFGKPTLGLPNVFEYIKYIKSVDGFGGCYRGLFPRLLSDAIYLVTLETVSEATSKYPRRFIPNTIENVPQEQCSYKDKLLMLWRETVIEITAQTVSIIISHPFQVISWRIMAQFVGRETQYSSIFSSIAEIYRTDGILGFFSGIIPRLIGGIVLTIILKAGFFPVRDLSNDKLVKFSNFSVKALACGLTDKFYLVTVCMAVNNSGLAAGNPPQMPIYSSWLECWRHLSRSNQLRRGSASICRLYNGTLTKESFWNRFQNKLQKKWRGIVNQFLFF